MPDPNELPEENSIVMAVGGTHQIDLPLLYDKIGCLLAATLPQEIVCDVGAIAHPDAGTIDALARLQLTTKRLGGRLRLRHVGKELRELLELAGLDDVLLLAGTSFEARGQPEEGEQASGIEEEADPGDLPV